jgi:hypothetical protein
MNTKDIIDGFEKKTQQEVPFQFDCLFIYLLDKFAG